MKGTVTFCFFIVSLVAGAQKKNFATLHLVHPAQFIYNTLLIKDNENNILLPRTKMYKRSAEEEIFEIPTQNGKESSFSIYFSGKSPAVSDSLYFLGLGNSLYLEIEHSFILRDHIALQLQNVFNFEELYARYIDYLNLQMKNYPDTVMARDNFTQNYALKNKCDFVKKNLNNPYSLELFSFFVIDPKDNPDYDVVKQFYQKYLRNRIKSPEIRKSIESKIEHLQGSLDVGNAAPSFSAHSIKNMVINNEALLGKNVLLIFWATWCAPCIRELPALKAISNEYKLDSLFIIGISLDHDSLKLINFISERNLDWVHIFRDSRMLDVFRINPIPTMFLINEKGCIIYNSSKREDETGELNVLRGVLKKLFMH